MAKEPTPAAGAAAAGLATAKTDSSVFRTAFAKDPAAALRAKGIVLSPAEATKVADQVKQLRKTPGGGNAGDLAAVKVTVGVEI